MYVDWLWRKLRLRVALHLAKTLIKKVWLQTHATQSMLSLRATLPDAHAGWAAPGTPRPLPFRSHRGGPTDDASYWNALLHLESTALMSEAEGVCLPTVDSWLANMLYCGTFLLCDLKCHLVHAQYSPQICTYLWVICSIPSSFAFHMFSKISKQESRNFKCNFSSLKTG